LAALNVTVKGTFIADRYTLPFFPANAAFRLRVEVDAMAFALPVSVSFQTTAPVELNAGELQDAVIPFGNPDRMLMDDPFPPVAATAPPTGVSVTVAITAEPDAMEIAWGETVSAAPTAGCTCKVKPLLLLRPSPTAVTTRATELAGASADAVSVNVSLLVLTLAGGVCGLDDHFAVTPVGSPLTE
jgi:hypothetical protein